MFEVRLTKDVRALIQMEDSNDADGLLFGRPKTPSSDSLVYIIYKLY